MKMGRICPAKKTPVNSKNSTALTPEGKRKRRRPRTQWRRTVEI
jgi:hypothetical protein